MGVTKNINSGEPNTFADAYKKAGVYKVTDVRLPNLKQDTMTVDYMSCLDTLQSYFDAEPKMLSMDDVLNIKKSSEIQAAISDNIRVVKNRNNPSYIDMNDNPIKRVITTIDSGHGYDYNYDYKSKILGDASATPWYQIPYDATPEKEPIEEDKFHVTSDKKVKLFYNK